MLAHIAPLAVILLFGLIGGNVIPYIDFFRDHSDLPWWQRQPEYWMLGLEVVIGTAVLAFFWKHYEWGPARGFLLATFMAIIGIALWIAPTWLFDLWGMEEAAPWKHLGFLDRARDGFDPSIFSEGSAAYWSTLILRFVRMIVIVALVEEIFWRGFLMRYLIDMDRDFWKIPFGSFSWLSFGVTTVFFMGVHAPADWIPALIYGALTYFVAVRTKSLIACVWMHGVANFLLGIYIMWSGNIGLW